jgi:hypothetical protein
MHKTKAPPSSKFFIWLALLDRCWTGERLLRHQMSNDATCALCAQENESISHLLLVCKCFAPNPMMGWWTVSRKRLDKRRHRGFDSLVVLVWWFLWKERNNCIFNGAMQQAATLASWIREEASRWVFVGLSSTLGDMMLLDTTTHYVAIFFAVSSAVEAQWFVVLHSHGVCTELPLLLNETRALTRSRKKRQTVVAGRESVARVISRPHEPLMQITMGCVKTSS